MRFHKKIKTKSTKELNQGHARQIYNLTDGYMTAGEAFKAGIGVDYSNLKTVFKLANDIAKDIENLMNGNVIITPAEYDVEGNLVTPAEYFIPTTENKLVQQLSCELLKCDDVLTDYMNGQTWNVFKASYGY